jgi:DNA-directed RNA polymerase specialized sigma24 family protein
LPGGPTLPEPLETQIHPTEESPTARLHPAPGDDDSAILAEAFSDLHGPRLHGFALLVALGDTRAAERAAGEALAAGAEQATALRHPERAAAWLRARTVRNLRRGPRVDAANAASARRDALASLGVAEVVRQGMATLNVEARAALVASVIERFEPIDVETILGASPAAARRLIAVARQRYLRLVDGLPADLVGEVSSEQDGPLAARIRDVTARAISTERGPR